MLKVACNRKRHYILDQTNVFPTARMRKLTEFQSFALKAVVVVPSNDEYLRRWTLRSQEEGKEVPEEAVLNMKANFVLPDVEEPFTDVWFTDLPPQVRHCRRRRRCFFCSLVSDDTYNAFVTTKIILNRQFFVALYKASCSVEDRNPTALMFLTIFLSWKAQHLPPEYFVAAALRNRGLNLS